MIILFFYDFREFFFEVSLEVVNNEVDADLLVHHSQASIALVARLDQCRKKYFLEFFVAKVGERQVAELLKDGVLSLTKHLLILFIEERKVSYEEDCFMEELLAVFLLVGAFYSIDEEVVEEVVELFLVFEVVQHLLRKPVVHPEDIVHRLH